MLPAMTSHRPPALPASSATSASSASAARTNAPDTSISDVAPGQSTELLKELHILTRDGKLNQDSRRKLKQVRHLAQFIEPLLADAAATHADVTLVDHGAGKSYLGFILYDLFLKDPSSQGRVYGV